MRNLPVSLSMIIFKGTYRLLFHKITTERRLYHYYYIKLKSERVRWLVDLTLHIFLTPPTVKFPAYDVC
jgi:hypothetical protein